MGILVIVNRSAPPGPVVPILAYRSVGEAIDWLCHAFGFTERLRTPAEPDGTIHHAQLAVGAGAVILVTRSSVAPDFVQAVSVSVADIDAHFATAKQFRVRVVNAPATYGFGERQYSALDLEGNHWTFSQTLADIAPEEWGAITPGTRE
jgi:uncharacterized glyoxalase superfamily protein PhnB